METAILVISWIATCLTGITLIPQNFKILKTRDTKAISLLMMLIMILSEILWIIYGALSDLLPIIVTNSLLLLSAFLFLVLKFLILLKKRKKFSFIISLDVD